MLIKAPWSRRLWWLASFSMAIALAVGVQWWRHQVESAMRSVPDLSRLGDMAETTIIFDVRGRPVFSFFEEQRREVPLAAISPYLVQAVLAVEDRRFYNHGGVDLPRMAGALFVNLREWRRAQGASTLTQQLARQSFLTADRSLARKLQEILLARRIEREYVKREILELYLNKVYFGHRLYGAEAAAQGYFGKPASDLTVDEAALLAGLVQSPSVLAPTVNLPGATARRNVVLQAMYDIGFLDTGVFAHARAAGVRLVEAAGGDAAIGPHVRELIRLQLVERFGRDRVYQGGLRVFTTIDADVQRAADAAVRVSLGELDRRRAAMLAAPRRTASTFARAAADQPTLEAGRDIPLEAALVAIDPRSGEVRAMVGGRRFANSMFNRAIQARRQPGSAFKPFVYAAALESGDSPATLIEHLDEPLDLPQGAWAPADGHAGSAAMTMRSALRTSSNRAAARVLDRIGIPAAVDYARRLGLGEMPAVPSLSLGAGEVTLFDLTSAYGAFAAGGTLHAPVLIRRVEDMHGNVLFRTEPRATYVVAAETAFLMSTMLADVVNSGTGWRVRQLGFRLPAAGKTGTTNDYHDAWFVGFTPSLVSGVWVGYDRPRPILPGSAYAGDVAVPLWARFMKAATITDKPAWFQPPRNIVVAQVCRLTGKRPTAACLVGHDLRAGGKPSGSTVVTEYFARGTEPIGECDLHRERTVAAGGDSTVALAPLPPGVHPR